MTTPIALSDEERAAWEDIGCGRIGADGRLESAWSPWTPAAAPDAITRGEAHAVGAYYAFSLIVHERTDGWRAPNGFIDPGYFMTVCEAITRQGAWNATEQGFFYAIGELLLNGHARIAGRFLAQPEDQTSLRPPPARNPAA